MDTGFWIELYGYLGSTLVVVSMLMASVVRLRVINTIGSIVSGTYALIIGSFPLALMNFCLITINLYNLFKLLKTKQQFEMIFVKPEDGFVRYFIDRHLADMKTFFQGFDASAVNVDRAYLVLCNSDPAGILLGQDRGDGVLDVILDYSVSAYRDCSVGKYLYGKLAQQGVKTLRFAQIGSDVHAAYLNKMGFSEQEGIFVKNLE